MGRTSAGRGLPPDFGRRLSSAGRGELLSIVEANLPAFTEHEALRVVRHPFCTTGVIEAVLSDRRFASLASVRKAAARHPAAPRPDALRCLEDLGWRDLLDVGRDARAPMPVRLAANQRIEERLPRLSAGERIALARLGDRPLLAALLSDPDGRVVDAVLLNPRLLPEDLIAWITVRRPLPSSLAVVAEQRRWVERPEVLGALLASAATPRPVLLALLAKGSPRDLRSLRDDPRTDPLVRACAEERLSAAERPIDTAADSR